VIQKQETAGKRSRAKRCVIIEKVTIDPKTVPASISYQLLTATVIPRPIGFISSISAAGIVNLAPFSFFNAICGEPPMIMFCPVNRRPQKDTLLNVQTTREFVANIVTEEIAQQMNLTAGDYAPDVSEFDICGLTPVASDIVKPPRVLESPVNMECKVFDIIEVSDKPGGGSVVIGEVVRFHVLDSMISKDMIIDPQGLHPIGRLGGSSYIHVHDRFNMIRPVIKK
jgi:flavin reductase (DIM6/NTAB) family NADH-FMN oxidoreductase RutF